MKKDVIFSTENIKFKKLISDDWEKFRNIRLSGLRSDPQAFEGDMSEEINRNELDWRKRLENSERLYFAAEENGRFFSIVGAIKTSPNIWMICSVHTIVDFRGRGFAQKLLGLIIEECKEKGAGIFQLMVNIEQKNAVHIYEKLGFKVVRVISGEKMSDGKPYDEYFMELIAP